MERFWAYVKDYMKFVNDEVDRTSIAEPCGGLGAARELAKSGDFSYDGVNFYDKSEDFDDFYKARAEQDGHTQPMYLGAAGDIMTLDVKLLQDAHGLVTGPPCQGFAPNGLKKGAADPRTAVMEKVLEWITELAHRGTLTWVALENSKNLLAKFTYHGGTCYMDFLLTTLRRMVPFFEWDYVVDELDAYFPHQRTRVWLRGLRADALLWGSKIPEVLSSQVPIVTLGDILQKGLPNLDPTTLTSKQFKNVEDYIQAIFDCDQYYWIDGFYSDANFACVDTSRSFTAVYSHVLMYDKVPGLRCNGPDIVVISLTDLTSRWKQDWASMEFFRRVTDEERFRLHGHAGNYADNFKSRTERLRVTGNAYAVPMFFCVAMPLLRQSVMSGATKRRLSSRQMDELSGAHMVRPRKRPRV